MSFRNLPQRAVVCAAVAAAAAFGAAAPAHAGRLIVTGHDADHHCARDAKYQWAGTCHYASAAAAYVRGGAPDPSKPVLLLDRGDPANAAGPSLDTLVTYTQRTEYNSPAIPVEAVDPRSTEFKNLALTTANYSAIVVASSRDLASDPTKQDLEQADIDAINARKADIASFYDAGGGLLVFSGGALARKNSSAYYAFINITRGGAAVSQPFSLTNLGRLIGFKDKRANPMETNDINCCETHVSFELPAPDAPLKVAETDTSGKAVTLTAQTAKLASIEEPPVKPGDIFTPVTPSTPTNPTKPGSPLPKCKKRKSIKVQLRRPKGVRFTKVTVYVNGKRKKVVRAKKLGTKRKTKAFRVKLSTKKRSKVRIVVTTASGRKITLRRTYKRCK